MVSAHCSLHLQGSGDSPASASQVARILPHTRLVFVFLVETGFHHVGQDGHELLASSDPLTSASRSAGITGESSHPALLSFTMLAFFKNTVFLTSLKKIEHFYFAFV